jgi:hypothetical protein
MTTTTATSLYIANSGRIACINHGGSYLSSAYAAKPERASYTTPLDSWMRMDTDFIVEWVDMVGTAPKCEDCR